MRKKDPRAGAKMMDKVINKKKYDTETALLLHEFVNGLNWRDFKFCRERLYLTKKGQYFLTGEGGPLSKYKETIGNEVCNGKELRLLNKEEAIKWLEDNGGEKAIYRRFSEEIEEG